MATPHLIPYRFRLKSNGIVNSVVLADSTTQMFNLSDSTAQVVLGPFDTTGLAEKPYGYSPDFPLMLKLYCTNVKPDTTGRFELNATGLLGDATVWRNDTENFGVTWKIRNWVDFKDADATISVRTYPPMTSVSMNCVCGLSTDAIDRKSEGSYL